MTAPRSRDERGAALLAAVLLMLILSILGGVSLSLGIQEIQGVGLAEAEAAARQLAEAGVEAVVQWFHDPATRPASDRVRTIFAKRYDHPDTGPSFFAVDGASQFSGTPDQPDLLYDAARPEDDRLLNDPGTGLFRSLASLGRVLRLRVYGPQRPGLLCTVEVTAGAGGLTRTVSAQLGTVAIPALRAAVQVAAGETSGATESPLPVWVHWGDLKARGTVRLEAREDVPVKTALAPVTGFSYGEMARPEDRWLDIFVGGAVLPARGPSPGAEAFPSNVYAYQEPMPGLRLDRWDYDTLKRYALLFGSYYAAGRDGLLYRHGLVQPGNGLPPDEVFHSDDPGEHHGLVFVDTLDQRPPRSDNLATLTLETDYAEGLFVVNAHLRFRIKGPGRSLPALSPPPEGASGPARRIPLLLAGINLRGVLYTTGTLLVEGRLRVHGAVVAGGEIRAATGPADRIEVWYDDDLHNGLIRGVPLVYLAPGSWQEK